MGQDIDLGLGPINGHAVGRILKEAVRRAMVAIRNERLAFEVHTKESYSGTMDDVFTSADNKAQEIYLRTVSECFPNCGLIAEESGLRIEPRNGCETYVTVDPLDGTKAFVRRQSHGVGTMVAMVHQGEIVCAYIGDINTQEIYGYRPGSNSVWRITGLDTFEKLDYQGGERLSAGYALLRDPPDLAYSEPSQRVLVYFKQYESSGGSIGIWAARLWKREVAGLLLPPGFETPWDSNPVIGISKKLGYLFLKPEGDAWSVYDPAPVRQIFKREHDTLIVHKYDAFELGVPKLRAA
jgi:hypothetical protein